MNTNYYRKENWAEKTFSKRGRFVIALIAMVCTVGVIAGGCSFVPNLRNFGNKAEESEIPIAATADPAQPVESAEINVPTEEDNSNKLVGYDVVSVGRSDPFMPLGEAQAFNKAKHEAIAEANAYNAKIAKLQQQLSNKRKDSNNRNKARIKLAKAFEKLNNQKENYIHYIGKEKMDQHLI